MLSQSYHWLLTLSDFLHPFSFSPLFFPRPALTTIILPIPLPLPPPPSTAPLPLYNLLPPLFLLLHHPHLFFLRQGLGVQLGLVLILLWARAVPETQNPPLWTSSAVLTHACVTMSIFFSFFLRQHLAMHSGWSGTHYVHQAHLELPEILSPASASKCHWAQSHLPL